MATNRNIVDMVNAIRERIGGDSGSKGVDGIYMATVTSVEPLTIRMHNISIAKNIFINPALMVKASNTEEKIKNAFQETFEEAPDTYQFLKEFHERYVLKKGDTVVVCMTGSSFYIVGKAVKA